ncbi:MAG: hypothetical protein U0M10_00855 [Oscillospiraceae bacterium]|nr:hypothetical protein [Oscillospiraceae bacterium]
MEYVIGGLVGLAFGSLAAFLSSRLTKLYLKKQAEAREKNTAAGENGTPGSYLAVSLGRQGIAILALALILLLRNQMPWPFTSVIIGAAIGLTGVSVVLSYRVAKQFEE